jgi:aldose 1-epimerase
MVMGTVTVTRYQRIGNRDYDSITLRNKNGMQATILNYGATLAQLTVPNQDGRELNLILSLRQFSDYDKERNYLGGTVGRIIGRMAGGQWQDGDVTHQFELNDGPNHAHGGREGFDTQLFTYQTREAGQSATVMLDLLDVAGHNGYPGNLHLTVTYTLDDQNTLHYGVHATTDVRTLCNPANHVYFNLNGADTICQQNLQVNADDYLPLDEQDIPSLGIRTVTGSPFDLRKGRLLGDVLAASDTQITQQGGLNHPFLLSKQNPAAILTSTDGQRRMTMATTAPAVVVYTANHFKHKGYAANIGRYDGVALEAQFPPSADRHLRPITLMPGNEFNAHTSWHMDF